MRRTLGPPVLHRSRPLIPHLPFHGQRQTSRAVLLFVLSFVHCLQQSRGAFRNRHGYESAAMGLMRPLYDDRRTVGYMEIFFAFYLRV